MGYICDAIDHYLDISKVLKIIDWPEYINVISVHIFMGNCIYYRIWIKNFA